MYTPVETTSIRITFACARESGGSPQTFGPISKAGDQTDLERIFVSLPALSVTPREPTREDGGS